MRPTPHPHDLLHLSFTPLSPPQSPQLPPPLPRATPPPTGSVCCTPRPSTAPSTYAPRFRDSPSLTCYRRASYSLTVSRYYPPTRLMHIPPSWSLFTFLLVVCTHNLSSSLHHSLYPFHLSSPSLVDLPFPVPLKFAHTSENPIVLSPFLSPLPLPVGLSASATSHLFFFGFCVG